ncbi:hypothetical protein ASPSYDRAFT_49464 [Aspergillus sydowii CBS 593.65]|uniref:Uncharacterized protein n=1 Tax=Aspergillus sydowii CBS 593.65 TaxID=1036612 RepID=A0A1L9T7D1_9EURO|nr:uncharacterized protein ASPSYDRAFT_49464 [Aspergillus sydowii CBS 593.65]OJJ55281.1 hypothetical protein ASPSYDRAFT_49464 [Aspergillus sydowii CBS 593.65]
MNNRRKQRSNEIKTKPTGSTRKVKGKKKHGAGSMRRKRSVQGEYGERTSKRREERERNLPRRGNQRRDRSLKRYKRRGRGGVGKRWIDALIDDWGG